MKHSTAVRLWVACVIIVGSIRANADEPIKPRLVIGGQEGGPVEAVAFSPDSKVIASSTSDFVHVWDAKTGKRIHSFELRNGAIHGLAFLPDGKSLLSSTGGGTLKRWDLTEKADHKNVLLNASGTISFALSPDGTTVAANYSEELQTAGDSLIIWDIATGTLKKELEPSTKASRWQFSPDGKTLAAGYYDGTIKYWDVATGKVRDSVRPWGETTIERINYSPDGRLIAVEISSPPRIRTWDIAKKEEGTVKSDDADVDQPTFSPDGRQLAVIKRGRARHRGIELWDAATGKVEYLLENAMLPAMKRMAFSPDGKSVAVGTMTTGPLISNGKVLIWDVPAE
jgi:WD40 repeat protein